MLGWAFLLFCGLLVGLPVLLFAGFLLGALPTYGVIAVVSGVAVCTILVFLSSHRRMVKTARAIPVERNGESLASMLDVLLRRTWFDNSQYLRQFVPALAKTGAQNVTCRAYHRSMLAEFSPLSVTFEPIPLDECAPAFEALEVLQLDATNRLGSGGGGDGPRSADHSPFRRLRRNVTLMGGWVWVVSLAPMLFMASVDSYRSGRIDGKLIFFAAAFCMGLLGVGGRGAWRPSNQWLLVPGGVVSRRPVRGGSGWRVHMFERRRGVLIVHQVRDAMWMADVADGEAHQRAGMTEREANLLLRAWLSPLSPPAAERLSDLE